LIALNSFIHPQVALFVPESNTYLYIPEGASDIFVVDDIIDGGGLAKKVEDARPEETTVHLHALTVKKTGNNGHLQGLKIPNAWGLGCAGMNSGWVTVEKSDFPNYSNRAARVNALERSAGVLLIPDSLESQNNRVAIGSNLEGYIEFLERASIFKTHAWRGRMGNIELTNHMSTIEGLEKNPIENIMTQVTDAVSRIRQAVWELRGEF
jgi:hypothetical protein